MGQVGTPDTVAGRAQSTIPWSVKSSDSRPGVGGSTDAEIAERIEPESVFRKRKGPINIEGAQR